MSNSDASKGFKIGLGVTAGLISAPFIFIAIILGLCSVCCFFTLLIGAHN